MAIPSVTAHGANIPALGFGTSQLENPGEAVAAALRAGYRHLDCARKYGTEEGVGEGLRAAGVPRSEIFITTKVSHENLRGPDFRRSVEQSLRALGVDHVDLLLIHWPNAEIPLTESVPALVKAKRDGLARNIGVANFNIALLDEARALSDEPLVTLQAEYHPYLDQTKLIDALRERGMVLTAYCPLGRGRLFDDKVIGEIARNRGKSLAQVALRWLLQQDGVIPIPRSSNPARIAENLAVFDFTLTDAEMKTIAGLRRSGSRIANPAGRAPDWD